ncbi:cbb3-type cytochrome c oxidase N-terminal domain-containing protein [Pedobacter ureilyticus]|uniref:Cbb3-type cytochrome c oxidase N-terminal domain-containing protein n=1 Tax=Pedobacter ureilyticus TaxID=1393051 RepID=A0ABW9J7F8_9SPHI|nr:cbb3-type cytochrome c oxidase N-terminal domain-containing protein [Pedobacter helvus]
MKKFSLLMMLLATAFVSFAQEGVAATEEETKVVIPEPSLGITTTELLIITLLVFSIILLFVAITLYKSFRVIYQERLNPTPYKTKEDRRLEYEEWVKLNGEKPSIWNKLLSLKPLSAEKDLEIPHAYDGIKELNNPVPAWFNVLFYGTLIFAAGYLYYYHIGEHGERQDDEYKTEMAKADLAKQKFLAKSASSVDENSVKVDPSQIAVGKGVFNANCIACHGQNGEGLVGPNLTDEFWLHGGSVKDIFKVVKYGVPEKGMVSWEKNMSSANISAVTNYILSLQGSKPANPKAPQGEKYDPAAAEAVAN